MVGGTGVVGAEWVKGCIPCWTKRMTPMLAPVPKGPWLKEMVPGGLFVLFCHSGCPVPNLVCGTQLAFKYLLSK